MNDMFLFSSVAVPKKSLEILLRHGVERLGSPWSLHSYPEGFQVRRSDAVLLDLARLEQTDVYLSDEEKAGIHTHYCLSYHPVDIDSVLTVLGDAIRQYDFIVAADAEGYTPRFPHAQLRQLADYVRETELRG